MRPARFVKEQSHKEQGILRSLTARGIGEIKEKVVVGGFQVCAMFVDGSKCTK